MKTLVALAFGCTLLAGAQVGPARASPAPYAPNTASGMTPFVELAKGGHGHMKAPHRNRGLHRGWTRGRGNPHRHR